MAQTDPTSTRSDWLVHPDLHHDWLIRAQRTGWDRTYRLARDQGESAALSNPRQQKCALHERIRVANALPRTATKRVIRKARQSCGEPIEPSLRPERVRFREEACVAVCCPWAEEHDGAAPDCHVPDRKSVA